MVKVVMSYEKIGQKNERNLARKISKLKKITSEIFVKESIEDITHALSIVTPNLPFSICRNGTRSIEVYPVKNIIRVSDKNYYKRAFKLATAYEESSKDKGDEWTLEKNY